MRVDILLFASLQDRAGSDTVSVELDDSATVADLIEQVSQQFPDLRERLGQVRVAVDQEFRPLDYPVTEDVEIALIPPVSGG